MNENQLLSVKIDNLGEILTGKKTLDSSYFGTLLFYYILFDFLTILGKLRLRGLTDMTLKQKIIDVNFELENFSSILKVYGREENSEFLSYLLENDGKIFKKLLLDIKN